MKRLQTEKCIDGLYLIWKAIHDYWNEMLGVDMPSYKTVMYWVTNFTFNDIDLAISIMRVKIAQTPDEHWSTEDCVRYISGIMWKRKRQRESEPVIPEPTSTVQ